MNRSNLDRCVGPQMGSTVLHASAGLTCRIGFYSQGAAQAFHSHPTPTISLLLSGTVHEVVSGGEVSANCSSISIKPPDVRHSDIYGRNGAVILSIAIHDPAHWAAALPSQEWAWRPLSQQDHKATLTSFELSDSWSDAAFELLSLTRRAPQRGGTPPEWLLRVAEQLRDSSDVRLGAVAEQAGVHPIYLARAFRSWYGTSPSVFRLRARTSAAIDASLWHGKAASAAALDAGFADQSHMARSIRALTGQSLSQLRRLAAGSLGGT